jgi:L-fuculose-phosphate aldolase
LDEYNLVTKELFEKSFLNIGIGSISIKLKTNSMIINKKNRHPLEKDFALKVHILNKSLAWEEASEDIKIHAKIYETYSNTKAIGVIFPLNIMTFAQEHHKSFSPIDYIGKKKLGKIPIIEINNINEWEDNKDFIISKNLKENDILIVNGFGTIIKSRDIREIIQKAIILENSAYILLNSKK